MPFELCIIIKLGILRTNKKLILRNKDTSNKGFVRALEIKIR